MVSLVLLLIPCPLFQQFCIFFNWDSLHARLNSHYQVWSWKKKKKKTKSKQESCLERTYLLPKDKSCLLTLDLKLFRRSYAGGKAFNRKRIPESSCARKQTVDIDILVTSRNGDRKIMQRSGTSSASSNEHHPK